MCWKRLETGGSSNRWRVSFGTAHQLVEWSKKSSKRFGIPVYSKWLLTSICSRHEVRPFGRGPTTQPMGTYTNHGYLTTYPSHGIYPSKLFQATKLPGDEPGLQKCGGHLFLGESLVWWTCDEGADEMRGRPDEMYETISTISHRS